MSGAEDIPTVSSGLDLRRILASGSWIVVERILRIGFSLCIGTWVARHLGPEQFGILGYVATFIGFLSPLIGLGIDQPAIRALASGADEGAVTGTALVLRLLSGALIIGAAGMVLVLAHPEESYPAVTLALAIAGLFSAADACEWTFLAAMTNRPPAIVRVIAMSLAAGLRIVLLGVGTGVVAFAWAMTAESAIAGAGLVWAWRARPGRPPLRWDPALARSLASAGWSLALAGLMVTSYLRIDQIMLQAIAGPKAVGTYLAAVRLSEFWWMLPTAIAAASTAGLVRSHACGRDAFLHAAGRIFRLQTLLALPLVIGICVLARPAVAILFGSAYAEAAPILAVLAWSGWFVALGVTRTACLTAAGNWSFSLWATGIGAVANIALNLLLIPRLGGLGAALATVAAQILAAWITTGLLRDGGGLWLAMTRGMLLLPTRRPGPP